MVNVKRYRDIEGAPPPQDESWWEAVLAEEEDQIESYNRSAARAAARSARKKASGVKLHAPEHETENIDWARAAELYETDQALDVEVTGFNRGGLLVTAPGLQGFIPVSHLVDSPADEREAETFLSTYIERIIHVKVIECDQDRGRVVFSERSALAQSGSRNRLLRDLQPGDAVHGSVTNVTDFGVFVDLGGVEGLIHVSEISWGRVRHPADVVKLGETVEVYVIQVDRERARVALSVKRLHPNPWESAEERYFPGQIVEAVITSLVPFGAFARLEEGLDGLIHVSEICPDPVHNPEGYLREGQHVRVRVLHVDGSKQRLGLSLRLDEELL